MTQGRGIIIPTIFVSRGSIDKSASNKRPARNASAISCYFLCSNSPHLPITYVCVPGVGRGGGVGQVGAAPAYQRGEADDEADDPDQADQQLRPDVKMY